MSAFLINLIKKILIIVLLVSCNSSEIGLYPVKNNHHRVEFDIVRDNIKEKKIGVASIGIQNIKNLDNISIHFQGIYQGEYFISSPECGINYRANYKGLEKLDLKKIVEKNDRARCLLKIKFKSDYIKEYKYQFEETAEIYLTFENFYKNKLFFNLLIFAKLLFSSFLQDVFSIIIIIKTIFLSIIILLSKKLTN
jgi:hypothetical protein